MGWLAVLVSLAIVGLCNAKVKPVRVSLDARWSSSPLLLEARSVTSILCSHDTVFNGWCFIIFPLRNVFFKH